MNISKSKNNSTRQTGVTMVEMAILIALLATVVASAVQMMGIGVKNASCISTYAIVGKRGEALVGNKAQGSCDFLGADGFFWSWK